MTADPTRTPADAAQREASFLQHEASPLEAARDAAREAVMKAEIAADQSEGSCTRWPLWERYASHFVSREGRAIDHTSDARSTSEGQAYGLFMALVADDRPRFDALLAWTEANLAGGDLKSNLPAWHWGKRDDGSWGVKDPNAASDADVWLAYTLFAAARAWQVPRLRELATALATQIAEREVVRVAGLGSVLLPGPQGFLDQHGAVRLNPSYLAIAPLRGLEREHGRGPWKAVIQSSVRILAESAPRGLAPDWVAYTPGEGFRDDPHGGSLGSYDAIRVYLWSALIAARDPHSRTVRRAANGLQGMLERSGRVPERIDVRSATVSENDGPPGFVAVALAYAHSRAHVMQHELRTRLNASLFDGLYGDPPAYYDQNLALFALGMIERRFQFAPDGRLLLPRNEVVCAPP